jgi:hypothetical protein
MQNNKKRKKSPADEENGRLFSFHIYLLLFTEPPPHSQKQPASCLSLLQALSFAHVGAVPASQVAYNKKFSLMCKAQRSNLLM